MQVSTGSQILFLKGSKVRFQACSHFKINRVCIRLLSCCIAPAAGNQNLDEALARGDHVIAMAPAAVMGSEFRCGLDAERVQHLAKELQRVVLGDLGERLPSWLYCSEGRPQDMHGACFGAFGTPASSLDD